MTNVYVLPEDLVRVWIVTTSSDSFNKFLQGGFLRGVFYTVSARQDRGKSNTCLDLAFNAAEMGFKVAYIDGDMHGVTVQRLYAIIKARYPDAKILEPKKVNPTKVYDYYQKLLITYNIDIFWEESLEGLSQRCIEVAESNHYTIIIVDSVTLFYGEYVLRGGTGAQKEGSADIAKIYRKLRSSCKDANHLKIVVCTTQRVSDVKEAMRISNLEKKEQFNIQLDESDREEIDRHMGGKTPGYFSDVIIQLTKFGKKRKAEYVKNRLFDSDDVANFEITSRGIV